MNDNFFSQSGPLTEIETSPSDKERLILQLKTLGECLHRSEYLPESLVISLKQVFPELLGLLPLKIDPISSFGSPFERIVINQDICGANSRLTSLEQLRYPPRKFADKLSYNRASLKGQSIFYAGNCILPVMVETQPKKGQLITKSKWQLNKGEVLNLLVICFDEKVAMSNPEELFADFKLYQKTLCELKTNTREVVETVYKFIMQAFTRRVDPKNKQGYLFSALIADMLFSHKLYPVDAIYYPSVPNNGCSMNIAIRPEVVDKKFTMVSASESFLLKNSEPNDLGWHLQRTGKCESYDTSTLNLQWSNEKIPNGDPVRRMMEIYSAEFSG